jgi:Rod binding domain-containing protein
MSDLTPPSSYLDFNALTQLRGEARHDPSQAIRKTAEQFEAYFLQHMMKEMRATIEKSELVESKSMETYQDMMDKEVAQHMVRRGGIGLADMLEKQMQKREAAVSAQEALQLHPKAPVMPMPPDRSSLPVPKSDAVRSYEIHRNGSGT